MEPESQLPILVATPVTFRRKGDSACRRHLGFIAEDLHAIDPLLVNLDAEGRPDSIRFEALCAHLLMALKDLNRRLMALEGS